MNYFKLQQLEIIKNLYWGDIRRASIHSGTIQFLNNFNIEYWNPIITDPKYWISSWGRVYSQKSKKLLKGYIHQSKGDRYIRYQLSNRKRVFGHQLVGESFLWEDYTKLKENNPSGTRIVIDHIDNNGLNNNILNLQWVTFSDNTYKQYERSINKHFNPITGERRI